MVFLQTFLVNFIFEVDFGSNYDSSGSSQAEADNEEIIP